MPEPEPSFVNGVVKNPKNKKMFIRVLNVEKPEQVVSVQPYTVHLVCSHNLHPTDLADAVRVGLEDSFSGVFDSIVTKGEVS